MCSELYLIFGPLCEGMCRTFCRFLPSFSSTCSTSGLVINPEYWLPCAFSCLSTLAAFPFCKGPFIFPEGSCGFPSVWLLTCLSRFYRKAHKGLNKLIFYFEFYSFFKMQPSLTLMFSRRMALSFSFLPSSRENSTMGL